MLAVRQEQIQVLSDVMLKQFEDRTVIYLQATFPQRLEKVPETDLRKLIRQGVTTAGKYKIEREDDVQQYLGYMVLLGADLDTNPKTDWAGKILIREDLWPWEKLEEIENYIAMVLKGKV